MWQEHFNTLLNEQPDERERYDNDWQRHIDEQIRIIMSQSRLDMDPEGINLQPFTCAEIRNNLSTLPSGKAPGIDLLAYEHFKNGGDTLLLCLSRMFNAILKYVRVPAGFKHGLLITLYKGGRKPRNDTNSYRGITLLPVLCKIFEKYIYGRMCDKMNSINFPPDLQFAAKKSSNCVMTSFVVQETIQQHVEKGGKVFTRFLDIEKCFDKVWWNGLMYKLHKIGITDKLWFC